MEGGCHMRCLLFKILYTLAPLDFFKARIIGGHFTTCPRCAQRQIGEVSLRNALPTLPNDLDDFDVWLRVRAAIVAGRNKGYGFTRLRLATIGAGVLMAVLILFMPFHKARLDGPVQEHQMLKKSDQIIIKSVEVDDRPAKTFYFKSQDDDRLIVWVQ